jgi:nucleosome-remodeling factor subunit BPTF
MASPGTDSSSDSGIPGIKRDRMYCVCKQKYDATKFYVGCDICSNWFHGSCVNITPKMSKKMSEYVCEECKSAKDTGEIYCLCQQPYDESQ